MPLPDFPFSADMAILQTLLREKAVAVGVSGGPDSMALCRLLCRWTQDNAGPAIHALTVDHGLRPEAAAEAQWVKSAIKSWPGVKPVILKLSLRGTSRVMEEARRRRYEIMADYCRSRKIRFLIVAHHQDDQAETFLFRLAKGSGLDGLAGMNAVHAYNGHLTILRPLLGTTKQDLLSLCEREGIPYVPDPSNENTAYARPRLRAARAALEEEGLSAKRLAITAGRLARARQALEHYAGRAFSAALKEEKKGQYVFDHGALSREPEEIRLRVLLDAMDRLMPDKEYGPRLEKMEILVRELFSGASFRRRTLGGVIFSRKNRENEIRMEKEKI